MKPMMRAAVAVALAASLGGGCVMNRVDPEPTTIALRDQDEGAALRLEVVPGPEWISRMQAGPFVFNVLPQFAVWTQDESGSLVETLYVTGADFGKMRHAKKQEMQSAFFAECLPVWAARVAAADGRLPAKDNPYPDAVTSATPAGRATLLTTLPTTTGSRGAPLTLFLEIDKPGDANATYTEETSGWVGQPSLVYSVALAEPSEDGVHRLELVGRAGRDGTEARIDPELTGLDTALQLIDEVVASLE